jgi:putative ABC transport system substrate-binding protein
MRRRDLIKLLGGATLIGPLTARAQQAGRIFRIGFISTSTTSVSSPYLAALRNGLAELGHQEGRDLHFEYRFGQSRDELPAMAADLVRHRVDVIVAAGSEGIGAAKNATRTIPIVMANSGDAVQDGFVASLARPGGNITGLTQISPELAGKRLELLKDLIPRLSHVAVLWHPLHPNTPRTFAETRSAAQILGLRVHSLEVKEPKDLEEGIRTAGRDGAQAISVLRDPFTVRHRALIADAVMKQRLPAVYETSDYVQVGGLMFYGADFTELFRRAATYVDNILKGANAADLPVQQPAKFEFVINTKAAKAIGLELPARLLARADQVIE